LQELLILIYKKMSTNGTYKGKNLRIKIDGLTVFHATECKFDSTMKIDSIATKDTDGEMGVTGNYSWGVSTNMLMANTPSGSTTTQGFLELINKHQSGTEVEVSFTTNIVGDVVITGNAFIEKMGAAAGVNGLATADATFKGNGSYIVALID